jgi:capsular exopolysaccharide synthesis family protein
MPINDRGHNDVNGDAPDLGGPAVRLREGLRRRRWILLSVLLVTVASALAFSLSRADEYTARATLLFRDVDFSQSVLGASVLPDSSNPTRQAATDRRLAGLAGVYESTARDLHVSEQAVHDAVRLRPAGDADLLDVTAVSRSPQAAARFANAFAASFIAGRRDADRAKLEDAQRVVQTQLDALPRGSKSSAERAALETNARQMRILSALQTGNVELAQRAQPPTSRSAPTPVKTGLIAAVIGLLAAAILALVVDRMDRRLRSVAEAEAIVRAPLLGTVRKMRRRAINGAGLEPEPFRLVRTSLRYSNLGRELRSIMITSADRAEGKSTVTQMLAEVSADAGVRTIVVEADLRRPSLAERLGVDERASLWEVAGGERSLEDALHSIPTPLGGSWSVVFAGDARANPQRLLESEQMMSLMREIRDMCDLVLIDTAPLAVVADAVPLLRCVDGVLIVAAVGHTDRKDLDEVTRRVRQADAAILGVVVNMVDGGPNYGYYS